MGKQELEVWKLSKNSNFLSFDGASKGNPGAAGGGGIISKSDGTSTLRFAWGLGVASNNRVEALALWQGLNQAMLLNIRDLVVLGDSRVIIQALNQSSILENALFQHSLDKIKLLMRQFQTIQIFHVLRENNSQADEEANMGASLGQGILLLNDVLDNWEIP
jgi:ribonuclease HI